MIRTPRLATAAATVAVALSLTACGTTAVSDASTAAPKATSRAG